MRRAAAVLLCLSTASACSAHGVPPLPAPPTTKVRASTTSVPDLSGVALREVPGRTTTTIALGPGSAVINGSVNGPDGPVAGAVVHVERLVGDGEAVVDVGTAADGTFALNNVKGGRWRIRAYRPPDLALVKPEIFYLEATGTKALALKLDRYQGIGVSSALAPTPAIVDEPANLVVQVTLESVDARGVVRAVPVPGVRVELFGTGDWEVDSGNPKLADGAGQALWSVRCRSSGVQPLSVLVGDSDKFPLSLPACAPSATTTTSSTSSSTSSSLPTSSSSSSSSTTAATKPGNR